METDPIKLRGLILTKALALVERGAGWAQESVVLREVAKATGARASLADQQAILSAWHELFREGKLCWGYDLDNPNRPFFHVPALKEATVPS